MTTLTIPLSRPRNPTGIWAWLTTVDHKKIGLLYGVTAFIMFLIGGLEALALRTQLARPEQDIVSPQVYNQLFTMHGTTMIFLVVMPMATAFINYVMPLQIGARDVAFPRLNAFGYWTFLAGAIMITGSFFFGSMPDGGWTGYAPLTTRPFSQMPGIEFWGIGLLLTGVSSVVTGLNFVVTILNMRAPGMGLMRMPLFTWMALITSILMALALTVLTVALIQLLFDRMYGTNFFNVRAGADPLLWQHLFWIFGHPEVYILILPAFGIVSEIIPVFSRKPLFGYPAMVLAGIVIAFYGFMVWAHHMFTVGLGPVANTVFAINTMIIAIPTGIKVFNWLGTLWGGALTFRTPMLFSVGFVSLFVIGGISGVMHAVVPHNTQQHDTYFVVAHLHYVLVSGAIFALIAGIYYWFPKITGRMYSETLGHVHFWLMFMGHNLAFFPMHFLGLDGMPRRNFTYPANMGWDLWNLISTIGAYILALSLVIFIFNIVRSWRNGSPSDNDPWDARTLEWSIPSPPPVYNFEEVPAVHDRDEWWHRKRRVIRRIVPVRGGSGDNERGIHMPQPSYWPLVVSVGLLLAGYGLVYHVAIIAVGAVITVLGIYAWALEPVSEPEDHPHH